MTKHLHLKNLLATLLTIAAIFAGHQAFATITSPMSLTGNSALINGQYYYVWQISGFLGNHAQPRTQGNSYTFNGQNIGLQGGSVSITGTLNFTESNNFTDVTTGSQVTVEFYSTNFWFYSAEVKKLDGTSVSGCSYSIGTNNNSITVTIPSGKTFGYIYLDYVAYEPFYNYNTTISGVESTYIYTGSPIEPVPTVTYNGTVLTAGTDYTVSYANNNALGTATLTVTGTGQYAGTVSHDYNIRAVALTDFTNLGNNTYKIATTTDLNHLASYVNFGNNCQGLTFKQTANITFTHSDDWDNSSSTENNYTAIGTEGNPFQGTYDGQNHTISGIRIYKGGDDNSDKRQGIFGAVFTDGTVKRVNLADARITGRNDVGGIVGVTFRATIEDCTVGADVCIHAVKSSTYYHGGIVGFNESAVRRCISRATLTVKNGLTYCNCYGGIVGFNNNSGTVTDCIAVGAVIPDVEGRGAIVGYNNNSTLIRNYYRDCKVASNNVTPSGVGMGTSQSGTTTSDVDGAQPLFALTLGTNVTLERTAEATLPGTNNKTYANGADIAGVHYAYPTATVTLGYSGTVPAGQTPLYSVDGTAIWGNTFTMPTADCTVSVEIVDGWSGSGTQSDPYVITTTSHLNLLAEMVKNGVNYSGTYFVLGNDIAYSTAGLGDTDENFTTIGGYFNGGDKNFSGTFDGQGHTISGIRLYKTGNSNPSKNQGLFGRISGATIKNVILTDARITGYRYVGGIVGNKASGTVQNCLVLESTITCENTYVGALFGGNSGTLTANHYHGCTVNGTANATNVGVGGNGGTSSSSDKNGARSAHTLTLGENITAMGESVAYQGTTYYASNTTVTLGYNNLPEGYTVTYTLNGTALSGNTFTMPANDNATVDASTALITYNITYDLDGGNVATANPTTYNVTTPTFTLNNPTKAGYTFTGWTGSNGTTPQTTVTIAQGSTGDLNYTAQWSLNTYNITYDLGGGSVATANPTTYNVQTPTFTLTNPTKVACNFDGWTGTDLTEPTMTVTIAQGSTGDRDYTAHWTQYAFTLTLGTDITASGTVAFTVDGIDYYAAGTEITLAYSGNIPEGFSLVYLLNGNAIEGNTFTMPDADVMVSTETAVTYIDADGNEQTITDFTIVSSSYEFGDDFSTGTALLGVDDYTERWYAVVGTVSLDKRLSVKGNARLILCDAAALIVNADYDCGTAFNVSYNGLTIYGQAQGTGTLSVTNTGGAIHVSNNITVNGGTVIATSTDIFDGIHIFNGRTLTINRGTLTATGAYGISIAEGTLTLNGGTLNATGSGTNYAGIYAAYDATVNILGGTLNATGTADAYGIYATGDGTTVTLGWTTPDDRITASSYSADNSTIKVKDGQILTDNTYYYSGTLTNEQLTAMAGQTLEPAFTFSITLPNFVTASGSGVTVINGVGYAVVGTTVTLAPEANFITLSDVSVTGTTATNNNDGTWSFTMPAADATVTATVTLGSVPYIDANGNEQTITDFTIVSSSYEFETDGSGNALLGVNDATDRWYAVVDTVNLDKPLLVQGAAHLILCDGAALNVNADYDSGHAFDVSYYGLTIYGQAQSTGTLRVTNTGTAICINLLTTINGGTVTATSTSGLDGICISSDATLTINRGTVTATGGGDGIYILNNSTLSQNGGTLNATGSRGIYITQGTLTQNGGILNATGIYAYYAPGIYANCATVNILGGSFNATGTADSYGIYANAATAVTLGWTTPDDRITASSIQLESGATLQVRDGQTLTNEADNTAIISGTLSSEQIAALAGVTLRGCMVREVVGYGNPDNAGGYYLIASPVGTVDPQNVTYMLDNSYDLYYFDQAENQEWRNYEASAFDLEAGKGYLYANSEDVTIVFFGMPYSGNGEVTLSKTTGTDWEGWNLVGNPFNETAYLADGRGFYTMNSDGSELMAVTSGSIEAMEGIFVIANNDSETLTFTTTEPANNGKSKLALNLSRGNSVIDRAIVRFNEGDLLPKFQLNRNSTKVYIPQDGKDYAIVNSETQGEIPVSFKAKENGSYTISVNTEGVEMGYLHLIDNLTGADIDLLSTQNVIAGEDPQSPMPSYTFTANTTDYASRFKLVFSANNEDGPSTGSGAFAYINNGEIIVTNASADAVLQVVDVTGRIVVSRQGDAMNRVSTSGMMAGVYVLRLINGNDVKTQKIVIE